MGVEIIGIVAEETERQRETLPRAVRRVAYRGLVYHVATIFVLGLNVSSNDPILKVMATENYASPFGLMVLRAGIPALKHVINAVTVIALLGVANTRLYVSVRSPIPAVRVLVLLPGGISWKGLTCRVELCVLLRTRGRRLRFLEGQERGMYRYTVLRSLLSLPSSPSQQLEHHQTWYLPPQNHHTESLFYNN